MRPTDFAVQGNTATKDPSLSLSIITFRFRSIKYYFRQNDSILFPRNLFNSHMTEKKYKPGLHLRVVRRSMMTAQDRTAGARCVENACSAHQNSRAARRHSALRSYSCSTGRTPTGNQRGARVPRDAVGGDCAPWPINWDNRQTPVVNIGLAPIDS